MRMLSLSYTIEEFVPNFYSKFQNARCNSSRDIVEENFIGEKEKNGHIKGTISMRMLILSYIKQQVIPMFVPIFKS